MNALFTIKQILTTANVEVDAYIKRHENVVFGGNIRDRAVESNGVSTDEHGNLSMVAVAAMAALLHDTWDCCLPTPWRCH